MKEIKPFLLSFLQWTLSYLMDGIKDEVAAAVSFGSMLVSNQKRSDVAH